ncbi:MAG: DEAD/DEAH box helicase [Balneolales bacterium]|nr:DEAD/DEAH box helicase [Balneolales bacterium]
MFKKNDRVQEIANPQNKGIIDGVLGSDGPGQMVRITYTAGRSGTSMLRADELTFQQEETDPWSNLGNASFYSYNDFVLNTIYHKIQNTVDNTISSLKASKTLFKPHQFIPLVKLLNYQQKRLLIADEVGLGKTIEAGHILLELYARGLISKVLVVCTKTLIPKWEQEMQEKFGFPFQDVDAKQFIKTFSQQMPPDEFFGVINYDKFSANKGLQKFTSERDLKFDLIICDEVQAIRNRETKRYKAIEPLITNAGHVVFLSATPINNKIDDLFNLLKLLDPVRYFNSENFENDININRPFIRAQNELSRGASAVDVVQELQGATVTKKFSYGDYSKPETTLLSDLLGDDPLFERVLQRMQSGDNSIQNRVLIQRDLAELNSINYLFSRTKKKDVEGVSAIRKPYKALVRLTQEESVIMQREIHALFVEYNAEAATKKEKQSRTLPILTLSRTMASCLPAYLKKRGQGWPETDSKFDEFNKIIQEVVVKKQNKIIVFAEFKETLYYLADRLNEQGVKTAVITGDNPKERSSLLSQFQHDADTRVLLASRVGTEGIDLQFCDAMVNYDLPWNPMVLEQRIGRIDRIGQESEIIHIYNMVVHGSIEEDVYDRLLMKIRIFEESIGVLEAILSDEGDSNPFEEIEALERKLYTQNLSQADLQYQLDQKAVALINQSENIKLLETELTDAMVQDHYFRDEINKIVRNERYVTPANLVSYVEGLIRHEFTQINIVSRSDSGMTLQLDKHVAERLEQYLKDVTRSAPTRLKQQLQLMLHDFLIELYKPKQLHLCFDSEKAFHNRTLHYVSPYHPLVYAATQVFKKKEVNMYNAFNFKVERSGKSGFSLSEGLYLLALNELEIEKQWLGQRRTQQLLIPFVSDLNSDEPVILSDEDAEMLFKHCQTSKPSLSEPVPIPPEAADALRYESALALEKKRKEVEQEERIRLESARGRYARQFEEFYYWQMEVRDKRIMQKAGIETILRAEIDKLQKELDDKMKLLDASHISTRMSERIVAIVEVV